MNTKFIRCCVTLNNYTVCLILSHVSIYFNRFSNLYLQIICLKCVFHSHRVILNNISKVYLNTNLKVSPPANQQNNQLYVFHTCRWGWINVHDWNACRTDNPVCVKGYGVIRFVALVENFAFDISYAWQGCGSKDVNVENDNDWSRSERE